MKPEEDVLGQELLACYKVEEAYEIVERDDGYVDAISPKVYFSEYDGPHSTEKKGQSVFCP